MDLHAHRTWLVGRSKCPKSSLPFHVGMDHPPSHCGIPAYLGKLVLHILGKIIDGLNTFPQDSNIIDDVALTATPSGFPANKQLAYTNGGCIPTVLHCSSCFSSLPPKRFDATTLSVAFLLFNVILISAHTQVTQRNVKSSSPIKAPNPPPPRPAPKPYPSGSHRNSTTRPIKPPPRPAPKPYPTEPQQG